MPMITVKNGESAGAVFELGDAPLVVGRDDRAEIQILDQGVSRRHAEFFRIGEMFFVRDLDSRNGTFVNEERIKEELLRDADEVRIASTVLSFEDAREPTGAASLKRRRFRTSPNSEATTTIQIDEHLARDLDDLAEPTRRESLDLKHLYRCSQLIAEAKEAPQLCEAIARLAGEAVGADHACVFIKREGSREFELEASYQPKDDALRGAPVIATQVVVEVVQTKRALLSTDQKDGVGGEGRGGGGMLTHGRPASVIGAPMIAHDQVHGVLYCACQDPLKLSHDALELITSMAIQAGIALQGLLLAQRQERILIAAVRTLGSLLEMRDPVYTGHSARVASACAQIAEALKLPRGEIRRIQLAALLHNVSKIVLPPGTPDDECDPVVLKKRNELSERLIRRIDGLEFVLPVITTYQERMDGSGLPNGLPGDRIPLAARILAVADRFDTLRVRGDAPDYKPVDARQALLVIRAETPQRFDQRVVDALIYAHRTGALERAAPVEPAS